MWLIWKPLTHARPFNGYASPFRASQYWVAAQAPSVLHCSSSWVKSLPISAFMITSFFLKKKIKGNWSSKANKTHDSACVRFFGFNTHYKCCVVLAAHSLVQGCNAIFCSEVQMCPSIFQHFDELCTTLQLCSQRKWTFCKIKSWLSKL